MLAPELIAQIRRLQLRAGYLVTESLAGGYVSAFRGQGIEFDEVREYVPGDDVRSIDWNVTARMNAPFIKVFREEREQTIMLLVDVSPSQRFGTTSRSKAELAAEFAAIIAFLATRNQDKVGLILFSDHVEEVIPAKKGRGHIWHIIRSVLTHEGRGRATRIDLGLEQVARVCKRKSTCFLVSDFLAGGYEKALRQVRQKHQLICVRTLDRREEDMPNIGVVEFVDAESGERRLVDTGRRRWREQYRAHTDASWQALESVFRRYEIGSMTLRADEAIVHSLERFMRQKGRA